MYIVSMLLHFDSGVAWLAMLELHCPIAILRAPQPLHFNAVLCHSWIPFLS